MRSPPARPGQAPRGPRAACSANSRWTKAGVARVAVARPRSTRQQLLPLGGREQRQLAPAAVRARPPRAASSAAKWPQQPLHAWRRRTGRGCSSSRRRAPPPASEAVSPGRTWTAWRRDSSGASARPRQLDAGWRAFWKANTTWNSGAWPRSRSGAQLLDQLLERQVLVRVGAERRRRGPRAAARRSSASPPRSARSTRVLTKKPIRPSISARCGRRSACRPPRRPGRCSAPSSAWKAASRAMNGVAPRRGRAERRARRRPGRVRRQGSAPRLPRRAATGGRGRSAAARAAPARRRAGRASRPSWSPSTSPGSQLALPDGEVGVLDRQRRQGRRRGPPTRRCVERRQLAHQHPHRPAVGRRCGAG